jgi:hypothetical protein
MLAHIVFLELLEKRGDGLVVGGLRWEFDTLSQLLAINSAEVFVVCDIEEVDILL